LDPLERLALDFSEEHPAARNSEDRISRGRTEERNVGTQKFVAMIVPSNIPFFEDRRKAWPFPVVS